MNNDAEQGRKIGRALFGTVAWHQAVKDAALATADEDGVVIMPAKQCGVLTRREATALLRMGVIQERDAKAVPFNGIDFMQAIAKLRRIAMGFAMGETESEPSDLPFPIALGRTGTNCDCNEAGEP